MIDTINDKIAKAVDEKQFDAAIEEIAKKAVDEYISRAGEEIGRGNIDIALRIIDVAKGYATKSHGYSADRIDIITKSAYSVGVENALEQMRQYAQQGNFAKAEEEAVTVRGYASRISRDVHSEIEEAIGFWYDHSSEATEETVERIFVGVDDVNELLAIERTAFRIGPAYSFYHGEAAVIAEIEKGSIGIYTQGKKSKETDEKSLHQAWKELRRSQERDEMMKTERRRGRFE